MPHDIVVVGTCRAEDGDGRLPKRKYVVRFRGGLVFKAHRLVYHLSLSLSVLKKKKKKKKSSGSW